MVGVLKVKDASGAWVNIAGVGPPGVSSVIVGSFGQVAVPADLPTSGLIPIDFDGVGRPPSPYQMEQGQSLYYDAPADPLDGHLFQYVDVGLDPTGWLDIGLIQGPPGPQGPPGTDGIRGPIGPSGGPIPAGGVAHQGLLKLSDVDAGVDPDAVGWRDVVRRGTGHGLASQRIEGSLTWGATTGDHLKLWESGTSSFGIGIQSGLMAFWVSQDSNTFRWRAISSVGGDWMELNTSGLKVHTGHINLPNDGHGIQFNGNAYIYKKVGAGLTLRKSVNNPMVKIENNDGTGGQDIVVVSGGQNLSTGSISTTNFVVINGSNGSNTKHLYVDCDSNNNAYYFTVLEARRLDLTSVWQLKGYQSSGGSPDCHAKMYVNLGTEGIDEVTQWADYGDGQVCILCHGPMSATHFQDRNRSEMVAGTMAPVDPALVGRLIDAVQPVTFARNFRSPKATDSNPEGFVRPHHDPIPTIGFDIIDAATPLADRLLGPEEGGYSVGGMLAVAIAEIKSLRARVAQLEGTTP